MRAIDADALEELFREVIGGIAKKPEMNGNLEHMVRASAMVIEMIQDAPTIEPEPHWISCEERLPEEYGEYRITWTTSASNKRFVGDSEYEVTSEWDDEHYRFKGEWLLDDYIKNYPDVKVIAWKPLEEPYREGAQE